MALLDLPTRQDFEALAAKLDAVLAQLAAARPPAADELLSLADVADYTRFDPRTVEQWAQDGRFDAAGRRVYLPAYHYSGRLRFKRADVEAFGLGTGVLAPSPRSERPVATKEAPAPKRPKRNSAVSSERALRVA